MPWRLESGYTLVELLVTITLFSVLSVGFYQVMFSQTRGSTTSQSIVRVSEEARAGFNRMIRDTREAQTLVSADPTYPTSYRVEIDFDGDGIQTFPDTNSAGDYEDLTFAHDPEAQTITLNGEVLMSGVEPVDEYDVFTFSSNLLEYDWDGNGVTSWQELDAGPSHGVAVGNGNGRLDGGELPYISDIGYALEIVSGEARETFFSHAQLRNRRFQQ